MNANTLSQFLPPITDKNILTLMHCNCRSISNCFDALLNLLLPANNPPSVIAVTETWLTTDNSDLFQIPNFTFVSQPRPTPHGGTGIFVSNQFNVVVRSDLNLIESFIECLFVELSGSTTHNILIGCIYRPPNSDLALFHLAVTNFLSKIDSKPYKTIAILGDFNLDLLKHDSHSGTIEFINNFQAHSYVPCINVPTRITPHSQTLIDNIFVKCASPVIKAAVIYCDISDHLPIVAVLRTRLSFKAPKNAPLLRKYSDMALLNFNLELSTPLLWDDLRDLNCTNTMFDLFHTRYSLCFDKHFPLRAAPINHRNSPRHCWMTPSLIKCCHRKNNLYKNYIKNGLPEARLKYLKYLSQLKKTLKLAEKTYYEKLLSSVTGNLKKTWAILNSLISKKDRSVFAESLTIKDNLVSNATDIAEAFNNFFVDIGEKLASKIEPIATKFDQYLQRNLPNSFAALPTSRHEIESVILSFDSKNSSGYDGIPMSVIKASIYNISLPLELLINSSISNGCFPNALKFAKVCPVFKSGSKTEISNYRPISVLSCFSKLFEKIISVRLLDYLSRNDILHPAQFGFRKNHSTHMALLNLYDKIAAASDNNDYAIGVFIDLSKAFDTLNHSILLNKLYHYGVRGITLDWFSSYLSNRSQSVSVNGIMSSSRFITCGVPQGSILGPLLFILYINDIVSASSLLHFILFADDTNLFFSCHNLDTLARTVNAELDRISIWFKCNKLSLNVVKTNVMFFGHKRCKVYPTILIDGIPLDRVEHTKFLGVVVDARVTWKNHIAVVATRISRGAGALNRVKHILPLKSLLLLYHTLIYPHLLYCCVLWGCASKTNLDHLKSLQKRALRIITHSPHRTPSKPLFVKLNLLTLDDICVLQTLTFMHLFKLNLLPPSCDSLLTRSDLNKPYCTRNVSYFKCLPFRTNLSKMCLRSRGPTLWDSVPAYLTIITTAHAFARAVFNFLISKYSS